MFSLPASAILRKTRIAKIAGVTLAFVALLLFLAPPLSTGADPGSQPHEMQGAGTKAHVFVPTTVPLPDPSGEPSPTF